ncbi:caspase family protein [Chlorobaculum thiosulfatiphilum]|nr:caspase family protein [Chlorobaculum thiosulfatiphilum]
MKRSILAVLLAFFFTLLAVQVDAAGLKKALIIYHNDWATTPSALKTELQSRGYTVSMTDSGSQGLNALSTFSNLLASGDQLVVYLAGHGSNPRWSRSDTSKATAASHFIEFNTGTLSVSQLAPLFEKIAGNGASLTVIDGSCNGGESVLYGMGKSYCVMATTGVYSPSLTGFPVPSDAIGKDSTPAAFGMWWASHKSASWLNGQIVLALPERINQRLFRNDNTDITNLSLFLRPSIGILTSLDLGGWNLHYQYCYLYRLIYLDDYAALDAAEKAKFTNSVDTYLSAMHGYSDPAEPFFTRLDSYLNNAMLLNSAAAIYAANSSNAWKTLANDPNWNVSGEPGKYAAQMKGVTPDAYVGASGFMKMAGEIDFLMTVLKTGYAEQEDLLRQIDAAAKDLYGPAKVASIVKLTPVKKAWPPESPEQLKRFNSFERSLINRFELIDRNLKIDRRTLLMRPTATRPAVQPSVAPSRRPVMRFTPARNLSQAVRPAVAAGGKSDAKQTIELNIQKYEPGFRTVVPLDKVGISHGLIDAMKKQKLEALIGKFKAISPTLYYAEGRISFLLSIVEDSISKAQGSSECACEQKAF